MRSKSTSMLLSCVLTAGLISCTPSTPAPGPAPIVPHYSMIVRLESRSFSITISAGPVYSISNATGQLLVENVSLNDLQSSHPELYGLLAPALAPSASASADQNTAIIFADDR